MNWIYLFASLLLLGNRVIAQAGAPVSQPEPLPAAAALFDRHIALTGGAEGYRSVKTKAYTADMFFKNLDVHAIAHVFSTVDGKRYESVDLPGMGKLEMGSDGTTAWQRSQKLGVRLLPQDEARQGLFAMDTGGISQWSSLYASVETVGVEAVDEKQCFLVQAKPKSGGDLSSFCFDQKSGLIVRMSTTAKTQFGVLKLILRISDYRPEGALTVPHQITTLLLGQPILVQLQEMKINGTLPPDLFALPPDVRALVKNDAAADQPN